MELRKVRNIVIQIIVVSILIVGYLLMKKEENLQIEKVEESKKVISKIIDEGELINEDVSVMRSFIVSHLFVPKRVTQDEFEKIVYDRVLSDLQDKKEPNQSISRNTEVEYLVSNLLYGLKNNNINYFLGSFATSSYLNYITKIDNVEKADQNILDLMAKITKQQTLESMLVLGDKEPFSIRFVYSDGEQIDVPIELEKLSDSHSDKELLVITNKMEDLLSSFQ